MKNPRVINRCLFCDRVITRGGGAVRGVGGGCMETVVRITGLTWEQLVDLPRAEFLVKVQWAKVHKTFANRVPE